MSATCLFCRILAGEVPSNRVYEDERCLAFLDIHPINPGHTLVIPKRHAEHLYELPEGDTGHLFVTARKIYQAIRQTDLRCEGANFFLSDDVVAGQEVPHVHLHVVPRFEGDGHRLTFRHGSAPSGDLAQAAAEIRAQL